MIAYYLIIKSFLTLIQRGGVTGSAVLNPVLIHLKEKSNSEPAFVKDRSGFFVVKIIIFTDRIKFFKSQDLTFEKFCDSTI